MMFDSLVKSVMMYGAEIWGWREQEGLERVQGKYLKWVLGIDSDIARIYSDGGNKRGCNKNRSRKESNKI
jgi:hypothetical protein